MANVKGKESILSPALCRSARGLLDMTQRDLASASGVNVETIRRFEAQERSPYEDTLRSLREAFERRGIEFLNGEAPGLRLRVERAIIH